MKKIIKFLRWRFLKIFPHVDYILAYILCQFTKNKAPITQLAVLVPAGDLNGGFGDDIMVAAFLAYYRNKVSLICNIIGNKPYLDNEKITEIISNNRVRPYTSCIKLLKKSSDIYIIGADILDGVYSNNQHRFRLIKLAHILGIHTHITGFSIRKTPSKYFLKEIPKISSYTDIKLRDSESFKRAQSYFTDIKLIETTDIAFGCPVVENKIDVGVLDWVNKNRSKTRRIVAYCPNTIQAEKLGIETYVTYQISLLQDFINNGCCILMLYHDLRNYALNMNDLYLSLLISKRLRQDKILFVDNINDGVELKSYLSLCDFTVTGRMHFGISGYTLGLPMFGICYYNKFEGLQHLFDISVEKSLIPYDDILNNLHIIHQFVCDFDINKAKVQNNIYKVVTKSITNF